MAAKAPNYYAILEIQPTANQQEIRDAYKKAALKHHPDRVPADSPERPQRTKKFQQINDAYFTLSDPKRRREYDAARVFDAGGSSGSSPSGDESFDDHAHQAQGGFPWSAFGFGRAARPPTEEEEERFSEQQFGSVFEEMMREQGMAEGQQAAPTSKFWSIVGGLSGGAMGFIVANFSGAVAGAVAGNRLGAIRDAKGKSVYAVFQELPQADKARFLGDLASKVFAQAVSG